MVEPPTCRATSTRAFWAISRTTPLARYFLKPCAVTVTLYKPGAGNAGTEYSPSEFVLVVRLMPFSALVTATCAFTTLAPVESRTVPVKEAVSWACTNVAESTSIATAIPHSRRILIPDSLSPDSTRTVSKQPNACIKTYQYCVRSFSVSRENVGLRPGTLLQAAGGFAHDQLRNDLAVNGADRFLFQTGVDSFEHDGCRRRSHHFHGLAHGGQGGRIDGSGRDVVKTHHRTLVGNVNSGFDKRTDGAEGGHVVKGHERGEGTPGGQQLLR